MHVSLKTAALLLSSWEIPLSQGLAAVASQLSLPKHLLESLDLDRWLLTIVLGFTQTRFCLLKLTGVLWQKP